MAKGGGSANKSYLYQETKALLNPERLARVPRGEDARARHRGVPAVSPRDRHRRHERRVRAEDRQARVGALPGRAARRGQPARSRLPRPRPRAERAQIAQRTGIGAQFGGKYFCHDVRVIRLPRHGASCPVAIAVSCSADRQALGKITKDGIYLEELEHDPAKYLPDTTHDDLRGRRRQDRSAPADERHPRRALAATPSRRGSRSRAR